MRFEYYGLPGTGKSYLCRELIQYYASTGTDTVRVSGIIEDRSYLVFNVTKVCHAAMFLISHPVSAWRIVDVSKKQGTKSTLQFVRKLINLFAELRKSENHKSRTVVEQGVLQAVWSLEMLSLGGIANNLLDEVVNWLPARVIMIEPIDNQTYIEQLANRGQGRSHFDSLSKVEIYKSLDIANKAIEDILELTQLKKAGFKVLRLVNDHQLDVAVTGQWISTELRADTAPTQSNFQSLL